MNGASKMSRRDGVGDSIEVFDTVKNGSKMLTESGDLGVLPLKSRAVIQFDLWVLCTTQDQKRNRG